MKKVSPDWILCSCLAAGAFIVSYVFVGLSLIVALPITALSFAAGMFFFEVKSPSVISQEQDLASALLEGKRKLDEIKSFEKKVSGEDIAVKVRSICESIAKILVEIKRDPDDLKIARQFLNYYLDSTLLILKKYLTLSSQNVSDPGINRSLVRVEAMLDTLNAAFEKQLTRLLTNDVMDLDTELSLLEKTIQMEGLGE